MDRFVFAALLIAVGGVVFITIGIPALEWYADLTAALQLAK